MGGSDHYIGCIMIQGGGGWTSAAMSVLGVSAFNFVNHFLTKCRASKSSSFDQGR